MSPSTAPRSPRTYTNPVCSRSFPDPFVLRFNGRYYAYGTGPAGDGRFLPMISSRDLIRWEWHGGLLEPLDMPGAEEYWAPEVACLEGCFYLYYAVGRTANPDHHLRLAVAEHPLGPWRDAGLNLTPHEIFAIDAHPFCDPRNGQWYLFYARDELIPPFAGTGIVVDRLLAMDRLEGKPRDVLRPYAHWQLFELKRAIKFGLDWYTVEGPFVVCKDDRYVCFYSGGRWENPNYGVGYLLADSPLGPWIDDANAAGPQVLSTAPGRVIGPGHNSVAVAPDLIEEYLVYHGWDPEPTGRCPRIDRLEWVDGRPYCAGPSSEVRPAPALADVAVWFEEADPGPEWEAISGGWRRDAGGLRARRDSSRLTLREPLEDFVFEVSFRSATVESCPGVVVGDLELAAGSGPSRGAGRRVALPEALRAGAWPRLLVRRQGGRLTAKLDERPLLRVVLPEGPARVGLCGGEGALFSHFALTRLKA